MTLKNLYEAIEICYVPDNAGQKGVLFAAGENALIMTGVYFYVLDWHKLRNLTEAANKKRFAAHYPTA